MHSATQPERFIPASEFLYDLPVGTVLDTSEDERFKNPHRPKRYVFVGWRRNTARDEMVFCEMFEEGRYYGNGYPPWTYNCTGYETALRKFPSLKEYAHEPRRGD